MNKVDRYDLNKITLEDCMKLNEELGISPIISNGEVIGFEKKQWCGYEKFTPDVFKNCGKTVTIICDTGVTGYMVMESEFCFTHDMLK